MRAHAVILFSALLAVGCAQVARPPGGPVDETPPALMVTQPESLAVGVDPNTPLQFVFSEKVDRKGFARALRTVPPVELTRPRFDDTSVNLAPLRTWPADTVVVWTLDASLRDKHGVALGEARQGAFTTGDSLPPGRIAGQATLFAEVEDDKAPDWTQLVALLELPPLPDQRRNRPWRSAQGDAEGHFELPWLQVPSGPFSLQVFLDKNSNAKRDPREAVATLDSLFLEGPDPTLVLEEGRLVLIDLEAPVSWWFCSATATNDSIAWQVWATDGEDSRPSTARMDSSGCAVLELAPGLLEWGAFLDLDGDAKLSLARGDTLEPFLPRVEFEVLPAVGGTLQVALPTEVIRFSDVDSLDVAPVPETLLISPDTQP